MPKMYNCLLLFVEVELCSTAVNQVGNNHIRDSKQNLCWDHISAAHWQLLEDNHVS